MTFNTKTFINVQTARLSFKPCYKWMTFNTVLKPTSTASIIGGGFKPCYKWMTFNTVLKPTSTASIIGGGFKPCYKWMTFNTNVNILISSFCSFFLVLNLVING